MLNGVAWQNACCLTSTGCPCSLFVYLRLMDGQGFAIGSAPEAHRAAYPVVWEVRQCAGTTYSPSPCMLGPTLQASCGNLRSVPRSLACLWMLTRRHTLGLTPRPSKSTALTGICFACRLPPPPQLGAMQGTVELWVDILSAADAARFPMWDVALPPPEEFELRVRACVCVRASWLCVLERTSCSLLAPDAGLNLASLGCVSA